MDYRFVITPNRPEDAANAKVLQAVLNKQWEDMGGDDMVLEMVLAQLVKPDKIGYEPNP